MPLPPSSGGVNKTFQGCTFAFYVGGSRLAALIPDERCRMRRSPLVGSHRRAACRAPMTLRLSSSAPALSSGLGREGGRGHAKCRARRLRSCPQSAGSVEPRRLSERRTNASERTSIGEMER
ncbi:unnamed protein product [Lampetra fluviatilis]